MADQSQDVNGPTVRAHERLWSQMLFLSGIYRQTLQLTPWSITLGGGVFGFQVILHIVPQRTDSRVPLITLCGEAQNLITLIIILAWIPTNVAHDQKLSSPFLYANYST